MKITIPKSSGFETVCPVTIDGETKVFPVEQEIDVGEKWAAAIKDMLDSQKKTPAETYVDPVVSEAISKAQVNIEESAKEYTDEAIDKALLVDENEEVE